MVSEWSTSRASFGRQAHLLPLGQPNCTVAVQAWIILLGVCVSLCFDDLLHVSPKSLYLGPEGLEGVAWQTKVERRRRGTKFAICRAGFSGQDWVSKGHSLILLRTPPSFFEQADYITFENDLNNIGFMKPISYCYFVKNLKTVSLIAVKCFGKEAGVVQEETDVIAGFTGHSMRATLITSLAHSGTEEGQVRTQGRKQTQKVQGSVSKVIRLQCAGVAEWKPPQFRSSHRVRVVGPLAGRLAATHFPLFLSASQEWKVPCVGISQRP